MSFRSVGAQQSDSANHTQNTLHQNFIPYVHILL